MSAIRSSSNRAEARKNRSTPYARAVVRFIEVVSGFNDAEVEDQVNKVFRFLGFVPAEEVQELREQRLNAPSDTETDASSETVSTVFTIVIFCCSDCSIFTSKIPSQRIVIETSMIMVLHLLGNHMPMVLEIP